MSAAETPAGAPRDPFADLASGVARQPPLRAAITAAYRRPEPDCVAALLPLAAPSPEEARQSEALARDLVTRLRAKKRSGGVEGLIHEYSLSSQEGVALMCLAEALLRIPDNATRDALIRDKIARGDWWSHLGKSPSLFVNAATWGLVVTGKLAATANANGLSSALTRLIARGGEPLIRGGVDIAMRMMGEQFVTGQTIEEALETARAMEAKGFRYSYDMLGEAAATAEDAARYLSAYEHAIHAIGAAAAGRGVQEGPGISIKLSALHPRYSRAKIDRAREELLPRVAHLARLSRRYDIGLNIDAEEADRLDLSLDLFEALATRRDLAGWNGLGFVVQAYGRRCPFVIDYLIDLARRANRRIMVRLVKGAYWDSEIKRAQVDGLIDFPVFTRKVHTDVSYLASARKLLAAPDAVFPQFATHNAQTLAAVHAMAGPDHARGQYEFQCLHGMGEALYEEVVGADRLDRPCRIYAPVGTHETLLAYLVRRLLENGANSSFVNRIADEHTSIDDLIADPVAQCRAAVPIGAPHARIAAPRALYGAARVNSLGVDLSDEARLAGLAEGLTASARETWTAAPTGGGAGEAVAVRNPADRDDIVGAARFATPEEIAAALARAEAAAGDLAAMPVEARAAILARAGDAMEAGMDRLVGLIVREAGRSIANAVAEVREAVDFLRFYAAEARALFAAAPARPIGPVVCISPWNFPLAIFTGQVAAAFAAGDPVLAKPAEETPLIAAEAVRLLHEAGAPKAAIQLVPGAGEVGAALVESAAVMGVMFTGSTAVARRIQRALSRRLTRDGRPIPLIAETGGQNAMIVDSSALAEQVVADVIASAFDSAGQRCSALRILCLQEEIAGPTLAMLKGAMSELEIGAPTRLCVDVGPVINADAAAAIEAHVAAMRARGFPVTRLPLAEATAAGTFVAPTLIEIDRVGDVEREVFGPVLHVLRYAREDLDRLIEAIDATGYGLTAGLHTRIDETIATVVGRLGAGNLYVNRNMIGATVGVQPFGGSGLSGTGPKAGGPLYLRRLVTGAAPLAPTGLAPPAASAFLAHLEAIGAREAALRARAQIAATPVGAERELPGPVGERNLHLLRPRGRIGALARTPDGLAAAIGAILATGNRAVVERDNPALARLGPLPPALAGAIETTGRLDGGHGLSAALSDGAGEATIALLQRVAAWDGPIVAVQSIAPEALARGVDYDLGLLVEEVTISTNTAAAGGNASLMTLG